MANVAKGVLLKRGATAVGKIVSINGPSLSTTAIDTTDLDAAAKTFLPGPYDPGEITVELHFEADDVNHAQILADIQAGTESVWHVIFTDGGVADWNGNAFVTGWTPGAAVDGVATGSLTLKMSGAVTES